MMACNVLNKNCLQCFKFRVKYKKLVVLVNRLNIAIFLGVACRLSNDVKYFYMPQHALIG